MNYKYDLSIVLPSIRTEKLYDFYESIVDSIGPYTFELIIVGPITCSLPTFNYRKGFNVKYLWDLGSPARCVQMGASLAEGKFITWSSDDAIYHKNSLAECIELLLSKETYDHAVIVRYSEGVGRSGSMPPDNYWTGWTHPDQRLKWVKPEWKIAPVGMYHYSMFQYLGGLDCRFLHCNMNTHDLAYRFQTTYGTLHFSPSLVMSCDQMPGHSGDHGPIEDAYINNDRDLFAILYGGDYPPDRLIEFDNWKQAETVWNRFK